MLLAAATAGLGGGNFASSMANISFFYPDRKKGFALGLNAAGREHRRQHGPASGPDAHRLRWVNLYLGSTQGRRASICRTPG